MADNDLPIGGEELPVPSNKGKFGDEGFKNAAVRGALAFCHRAGTWT